jgi:hypothetical protein
LQRCSGAAADGDDEDIALETCEVRCSSAEKDRFIVGQPGKNVYGSSYHVREPETRTIAMTFPDFVECLQKWKASEKVFLQVRDRQLIRRDRDRRCLN